MANKSPSRVASVNVVTARYRRRHESHILDNNCTNTFVNNSMPIRQIKATMRQPIHRNPNMLPIVHRPPDVTALHQCYRKYKRTLPMLQYTHPQYNHTITHSNDHAYKCPIHTTIHPTALPMLPKHAAAPMQAFRRSSPKEGSRHSLAQSMQYVPTQYMISHVHHHRLGYQS